VAAVVAEAVVGGVTLAPRASTEVTSLTISHTTCAFQSASPIQLMYWRELGQPALDVLTHLRLLKCLVKSVKIR
jgi:hypothetical protein